MSVVSASEAGGAAIRVEGLVKRYGRQVAVDRLTLTVPNGAVFGLLGENGAGKTTTIRILLGLTKPDAGRVEVQGLDPAREGLRVRRSVGYVPEVPTLYDWMTVREIGWFAAGFHPDAQGGTAAFVARYDELTRGFNLPDRKRMKELSKGMRAKVSLAIALAGDPGLLILDEPTSGLDLMVRHEFLESMVDRAGAGRTVLLSSHQISEVERVASHVALLHGGRLILAEPLDELKARTFALSLVFASRDHPTGPPENLPVDLIDATDAARQARWLVRANDRAAVEAIRLLPGVDGLDIEAPDLESIYIGYMRGRRPAGSTTGSGGPPSLSVHVA
ncbi:MAG: ABC transporter ATP-binding protein [Isosphaeraceae bacterium]